MKALVLSFMVLVTTFQAWAGREGGSLSDYERSVEIIRDLYTNHQVRFLNYEITSHRYIFSQESEIAYLNLLTKSLELRADQNKWTCSELLKAIKDVDSLIKLGAITIEPNYAGNYEFAIIYLKNECPQ
ncbi:MAG: hypothetical protein V4596_03790 [Bdellovibrionota bacterium]